MYRSPLSKQNGFTLVEMAIVMIVIGLLITGILKGQELVANSRVTGTIRMITSIQAVATNFKDMYAALPGDVIAAKIPGCTGANFCEGGDETGAVASLPGEDLYAWRTRLTYSGHARESFQFWKHLALTDLLAGIDPTANPATDSAFGVTHPMSPFGGGFEFYYDGWMATGADAGGTSGHIMRLSQNGIGDNGTIGGLISPTQASTIDRKLDDGLPNAGYVIADYGSSGTTDCKVSAQNRYREELQDGVCLIYIKTFR